MSRLLYTRLKDWTTRGLQKTVTFLGRSCPVHGVPGYVENDDKTLSCCALHA